MWPVWFVIISYIAFGLLATIGFLILICYEDGEEKRERIARDQGYYPPVRTLAAWADARLYLSTDPEPRTPGTPE